MEAVILFSLLIVTIGLSIPIGITLGLSTGIAMWLTSDIPMVMLAQKSQRRHFAQTRQSRGKPRRLYHGRPRDGDGARLYVFRGDLRLGAGDGLGDRLFYDPLDEGAQV